MKDANKQGTPLKERLAKAEEHRKNATISDIIAEKRREADSIEQSARGTYKVGYTQDNLPFTEGDLELALDNAAHIRKEADRLEAALRRELAACAQITEKLRKALVQCELFLGNVARHGHQTLNPGDKCTACSGVDELRGMVVRALAEPPPSRDAEDERLRKALSGVAENLRIHLQLPTQTISMNRQEVECMASDCEKALAEAGGGMKCEAG